MAYSSPPTVVTGTTISSTTFGNKVKTALDYLANPPACRVTETANQSLTNNTLTDLTFGAETYDTDGMHSTVSQTERITMTTAGLYIVTGYATFATDTDITEMFLRLLVSGTTDIAQQRIAGTLSGFEVVNVTGVYKFSAGQYVTLNARQTNTSGGANNVTIRALAATWLGLG